MSNWIQLNIDFNFLTHELECLAIKGDFSMKVTYSNVKADSCFPTDLGAYVEDFLEEFESSLNKHIEIFCEVKK